MRFSHLTLRGLLGCFTVAFLMVPAGFEDVELTYAEADAIFLIVKGLSSGDLRESPYRIAYHRDGKPSSRSIVEKLDTCRYRVTDLIRWKSTGKLGWAEDMTFDMTALSGVEYGDVHGGLGRAKVQFSGECPIYLRFNQGKTDCARIWNTNFKVKMSEMEASLDYLRRIGCSA